MPVVEIFSRSSKQTGLPWQAGEGLFSVERQSAIKICEALDL